MIVVLISACFVSHASPIADAIVVCPKDFDSALAPWIEYRKGQGHTLEIVRPANDAESLRTSIVKRALERKSSHVVLIGDADIDSERAKKFVPTLHPEAKVIHRFGPENEIASDNGYGDLNGDGSPELAVGRISVNTSEELASVVRRTIAYEQQKDLLDWGAKINLVAGVGDFGPIADATLEGVTKQLLLTSIPASYDLSVTYGNWRSQFCPNPKRFDEVARERFGEGCLFWVYAGHGHPFRLDRLRFPDGEHPIAESDSVKKFGAAKGSPIVVSLACYTGAFDAGRECFAEQLYRQEQGPVAVLCGSRVTTPYGMTVLGHELMKVAFQGDSPTLGDMILRAKRRLADVPESTKEIASTKGSSAKQESGSSEVRSSDRGMRPLFDLVATLFSPTADVLPEERKEHVRLFNLIGDPLLALPRRTPLDIQTDGETKPSSEIVIRFECRIDGPCRVRVVCARGASKTALSARDAYPTKEQGYREFEETYAKAHDTVWVERSDSARVGENAIRLVLPKDCHGACEIQVRVANQTEMALGSKSIEVSDQ